LWIEARGRAGSETHQDMSVLLHLVASLDVLSARLEVAKLSSFFDYSQLETAFDIEGPHVCKPAWSRAIDGLDAVKALRVALQDDFAILGWAPRAGEEHWPHSVMEDLQWCQNVLERAVADGQAFRLLVVP
jgi:hypothetical protein